MVTIADRLFGSDFVFSTFAAGRHQMDFVTASALRGGHVRVGLEDSLMIARGTPATDNAQAGHQGARRSCASSADGRHAGRRPGDPGL